VTAADLSGGPGDPSFDDYVRDELLPDFRVVRLLGKGSMAAVYLAKDVALDQMRAIKVLLPSKTIDKTSRKRFEREARSAARISHPNVTPVLRVGALSDETPFLVMEYVDGRNLEDVIEGGGPLSIADGRDVLRQLAAGLAAAHEQGITHRDLKPANILCETSTGRVRLTDFGVAAVRDTAGAETTRLTVQGQVLGDVAYVAPEHLLGEELTELADIYSLGVIGYVILTGSTPYPNAKHVQLITEKLRSPPTPLLELLPEVDPELAAVLERCLARKPEHRPTAAEVVRLLGDEQPAEDGVRGDETPLELFFREMKRRRVYRVAVGYAAAALGMIGLQDAVADPFGLSAAQQSSIIIVILLGFPVALVLGWMFDIRRGTITRTADTKLEGGPRLSRVLPILALVASLLMAAGGIWWVLGH